MKVEKIAVLGAGNGGITAAADLSSRGFKVNLYQMPGHEKSLKAIKEKGEILLQEPTGDKICKINLATTDIKEAIEGCQIIIDRKSTRLNSSHVSISYAVFCLKKKRKHKHIQQD